MNKISYPQLVKDIADAYRAATKTSELVSIGELANKIEKAITSIYKSITYNEDNTITLIDNDDIEHTMVYVYEDNKITAITLDDEEIKLSYNGDDLVAVDNVATDLSNVPKNSTSGLMFETKPNAEILTMYPTTVNNNTLSDSSFNTNATAEITEE